VSSGSASFGRVILKLAGGPIYSNLVVARTGPRCLRVGPVSMRYVYEVRESVADYSCPSRTQPHMHPHAGR
jgi:hypothetical protein